MELARKSEERLWLSTLLCAACAVSGGALSGCADEERAPRSGGPGAFIDPSITEEDASRADAGSPADAGDDSSDAAVVRPDAPTPVDPRSERVVISDSASNRVWVVDGKDGSEVAHFDLPKSAQIRSSSSGRYAFLASADDSAVRVLDVGFAPASTASARPELLAPTLLDVNVPGQGPASLLGSGPSFAASFAGEPLATFFSDTGLPGNLAATSIATGLAHDGLAFTLGNRRFVSVLSDASPAVSLHSVTDDDQLGEAIPDCTAPSEVAVLLDRAAVSCAEGVLLLTAKGTSFESLLVAYPVGSTARASKLQARPGKVDFVAAFGDDKLLHVHSDGTLEEVDSKKAVALRYLPGGAQLMVVNSDGELEFREALGLKLASNRTVDLDCGTPNSASALPAIALGLDSVYITCPGTGMLHAVTLDSAEPILYSYSLGMQPTQLAVFHFGKAL